MTNERLANRNFLRIDELYAWITSDDEGEGVLGGDVGGIGFVPLLGADKARIESYRSVAMQIARESGRTIRLVVFRQREELEVHGSP